MLKKIAGLLMAVLLVPSTFAAEEVPADVSAAIIAKLKAARPDMQFGAVEPSPIDGLYIVRINGTQFLYTSVDGEYVVAGEMYQSRPGMFVPVKDVAAAKIRQNMMSAVAEEDMIIFPAVDERRSFLYVFTDVDCGYCRKLHLQSVPELNMAGVEVRYLAYPRAGIGSPSYKKIASAWCADDKQSALTALKNNQPVPENVCEDNPVAAQFQLGQKVGVNGTPALVLEDGTLLPGYRPAPELLKIMGLN
ncbi:MAG: DsbC family protein [Gammaproteobacteria bacterium]|nr:MAG: DsbC family protein [Gammaproteobacteria bacterium]